ncbi:hypothetical protein F4804DRAFT_325479 [Jackrogersella minutella]|nr:hypothetical protein F4804DRAFT_325479 [Jackrogersella minutella]
MVLFGLLVTCRHIIASCLDQSGVPISAPYPILSNRVLCILGHLQYVHVCVCMYVHSVVCTLSPATAPDESIEPCDPGGLCVKR